MGRFRCSWCDGKGWYRGTLFRGMPSPSSGPPTITVDPCDMCGGGGSHDGERAVSPERASYTWLGGEARKA